MANLLFAIGDTVRFERDADTAHERTGIITRVDHADESLPYFVTVDNEGGYWVAEMEILARLTSGSEERLIRIEAKLDALITHLGVKVEL